MVQKYIQIAATMLVSAVAAFAGVTVTSPTSGSTVGSPVTVKASATMSNTVTAMAVYVDNVKKYTASSSSINTSLSLSSGTHYFVIQSWDKSGNVAKSGSIKVTVSSSSSGSTAPAGSTVYSNIDQMSGWQSCDSCAGIGGAGATTPYSTSQNQSSPSMDGKSQVFWIGGTTPYADALWWKQLGPNDSKKHFIYDLYFYYTDANAPQALEFDVNQAPANGYRYIFGTQCSPRGSKTWDVWDNINAKWVSTGVACPAPPTYKWNHLIWEFERTSDNKIHFIAVTLNGVKSYVNKYYSPRTSGSHELNTAFQMDKNYAGTSFKVWLDKVTLTAY